MKLTSTQKRELDLLRMGGGSSQVYNRRLLNVFESLQKKGYVKMEYGGGSAIVTIFEKDK